MEKYSEFIKKGKSGTKTEPYQIVLDEIQINLPFLLERLKDNYEINANYLYDNENSFSLKYSSISDDNDENIQQVRDYLSKNLPYVKETSFYKDDERIVVKFLEIGNPIKYKFLN
jgi:hypothetical protein